MRHGTLSEHDSGRINWQLLKRILPYLLDYKPRIAIAFLCLILAKGASVVGPFILKHIVDALDQSSAQGLLLAPLGLVLAFGMARFANVLFGELRDTVFGRVTERAMRRIGLQVFEHLHSLDLDFHLNRRTGGLSRDIERGTTGIGFLLRFFVFNIGPTLIEILMVVGLLFINYGTAFGLIPLLSIALYVAYSIVATEWRTKYVRQANLADSASNTRAVDSLLNFETVKYFGNERFEADRYDVELGNWEQARRKNRLSLFALNGGQALIIAVSMTGMMWLAAEQVRAETMSIGDFVLINAFMMQLFMPLNFLGFVYREIKGSMANIEHMFSLLRVKPAVAEVESARELVLKAGEVRFEQVEFGYRSDREIIRGLSFSIEPGQTVAVVGASGAGKSTLVKLLFRFYDCNAGRVLIDGQDISQCSLASLRKVVGIVPQDTVLFNDTLFENVRYGRPEASDEQVHDAIRMAHLQGFIAQLPDGENTQVGERGLKLSGGERQRVAIARTILKGAPILVFDEATSSLDSHSEQAILGAINQLSRDHTSLVIAHRLSTIVDADKILVLDGGKLLEQGSHQQLLAQDGAYAALWNAQQKQQG
ncbi:MAG: ABC transporter ATP-binding protein/permease [Motiliproteus sp.]